MSQYLVTILNDTYNNDKHGKIVKIKSLGSNLFISTKYGYFIVINVMMKCSTIHKISESSFKFDIFPCGKIACAFDNTIRLYDISSNVMIPFASFDHYVVCNVACRSFDVYTEPSISFIVTISNNLLITASEDGLVKWWFYCEDDWNNLFKYTLDCKYVTFIVKLNDDRIVYGYNDGSIELYQFDIVVKPIKHQLLYRIKFKKHTSHVPSIKVVLDNQLYLTNCNSINLLNIRDLSQREIGNGLKNITCTTTLIEGCIMLCSTQNGSLVMLNMRSGKFYTLENSERFEHVKDMIISSKFDVIIATPTKFTYVASHSILFYLKKELLKIVWKCCGVLDRDIDVTQILEFLSSIFKSRNILPCKNVFNACKNVFNDTNLYRQISEYI